MKRQDSLRLIEQDIQEKERQKRIIESIPLVTVTKQFESGYYEIIGMPDNRSSEWFEIEGNNSDRFLWIEGGYGNCYYESPLHQAQKHCLAAVSRESRRDMRLTLEIAPECGMQSRDWNVEIDNDHNEIVVTGNCEWPGKYRVVYIGPENMFSHVYNHEKCTSVIYWKRYREMERLCDSGDQRFRRSKRSGLIIYAEGWPRFHSDGTYWEGAFENSYLSFDETESDEQWEYMFDREKWLSKPKQRIL